MARGGKVLLQRLEHSVTCQVRWLAVVSRFSRTLDVQTHAQCCNPYCGTSVPLLIAEARPVALYTGQLHDDDRQIVETVAHWQYCS